MIISHLEEAERRLAALAPLPKVALQAIDKKGKGDRKCWHCNKKGHVKVKCYSWLKDTEEGREYAAKHPLARTGPLPTPGTKGNLSPREKVQVVDEYIDEAY